MTPEDTSHIADAVIRFYSDFSSDGLERDAPCFTRAGLCLTIDRATRPIVQAAILAERERCAGKLCSRCKSGFPYAGNGFHTNPYHTPEGPDKNQLPPLLPCDAAAIREEPT